MNSNKVSGWGAYQCLLPGYDLYDTIDLARDRRILIGINLSGMAVMAVMFIYAFAWRPEINACFDQELPGLLLALAVMVAGYIAYIVLHELVHGITMKYYGTKKIVRPSAQQGLCFRQKRLFLRKGCIHCDCSGSCCGVGRRASCASGCST